MTFDSQIKNLAKSGRASVVWDYDWHNYVMVTICRVSVEVRKQSFMKLIHRKTRQEMRRR